jgi:methylated-DNA-[protein]-cysteine S-methyltransferase
MTLLESAAFESPLGTITVAVQEGRLCALDFGDRGTRYTSWLERRFGRIGFAPSADPAGIISALDAYFGGRLSALDGIVLDPGGTAFQARVWAALCRVPAGRTTAYGDLAAAIGAPNAARAVGAANGQNPIAIVIPCHRAIGRDRRLVGYAGGLDRKRWLLQHEGAAYAGASDVKLPLAG